MRNYGKEAVFVIEDDPSIQIDRMPILYDPNLVIGDTYIAVSGEIYKVANTNKIIDAKLEYEVFIYFLKEGVSDKITKVLSGLD